MSAGADWASILATRWRGASTTFLPIRCCASGLSFSAERSFFRAAKREPRDDRLDRPDEQTTDGSSRRGFARGFNTKVTTWV